ncbi:MAG: tRNA pseudouridine(38-40) synthase TruA, partial [Spirochaetales bacterium]|nr:tRNA pseudouridine(38-40) synthase TruA [Spirochaetales bacterium]
ITENGGLLRFDIYGNGFLYNMIRIIIGTLIEIGAGKRPSNDIPRILAAKQRDQAGFLAPPQGLCLEEVFY